MISPLLPALAGIIIAWIGMRQMGGQTGDVLGGSRRSSEAIVLLVSASLV